MRDATYAHNNIYGNDPHLFELTVSRYGDSPEPEVLSHCERLGEAYRGLSTQG